MKQRNIRTNVLALLLSTTLTGTAFASGGHHDDDHHESPQTPSITVNAPATSTSGANPVQNTNVTANPTTTSGSTATGGAGGNVGAITVTPHQTLNGGNNASSSNATANPIVSPIISPTISGGNSTANLAVGPITGGSTNLSNVGNGGGASLHGTVSGSNTMNGNVNGTVNGTNNVHATTGNNTNTLNGGSVIDNSKTTNNVHGGATTATGTANVSVGDQVIHNTTTVNASGGQGGAGGKGGESSSTSSVKDSGNSQSTSNVNNSGNSDAQSSSTSTGGSVSHTGNISGSGNSSVVINNPKPIPFPAPIPSVNAQAPTLFFNKGEPANATATRLAIEFLKQCPPTFDEADVSEIRGNGASNKTRAIFTPHSNYTAFKKSELAPRIRVVMTPEQLPAGKFKCTCLGLLQVEAYTSDASEVAIQTVINDAGIFARDKMRGYTDVKLVLIPAHAVSINMGADANASGFGVAPGFSGLLNTVLGTIGANASKNTGRTFPAAQIGATFAVVAGGDIPDGAVSIDLGAFMNALTTP